MNTIDCTLVPVANDDDSILFKMRVFGIFTPDEDKVTLKGQEYYCVSYSRTHFTEDSLAALEVEEFISGTTKKAIKTQYLKICSFAFIFGIGKDCVRDKYNRLIPVDLTPQDQHTILENKNGMYPPRLVSESTDDIYGRLDNLEDYNTLTSDQKWGFISKYQDQMDHDDLILEEPEIGTCCCCDGPCNPYSQACGTCARNGRLVAWGMGLIDKDGNEPDSETTTDSISTSGDDSDTCGITSTVIDVHRYNDEDLCILKDVIKCYRDQFRGCLDPKKAIEKKNIPHHVVSRHKKQWVPCVDAKERKAKILVPVSWVRANILGFFQ